jgi:hypothetical protein
MNAEQAIVALGGSANAAPIVVNLREIRKRAFLLEAGIYEPIVIHPQIGP